MDYSDNRKNNPFEYDEQEIAEVLTDTSSLLAKKESSKIEKALQSYVSKNGANSLTNDVEFWKWMGKNYHNPLKNNLSKPEEIARCAEKLKLQIQGKGYEWDYMQKLRNSPENLFCRVDAGTNPTQPGIDITKTNMLTGKTQTYQNKAYTSNRVPDLHNTPKNAKIVTNVEKVDAVREQGYDAETFKTSSEIKSNTQGRLKDAKTGKNASYTVNNVAGVMAKAGIAGFVVGSLTESIYSYRLCENGGISNEEYLKRILLAGGNGGVTGAVTAGIMIPISATITAAGIAAPWTIPIAIFVGAKVDKVIAPMFNCGDYAKYLAQAQYYVSLDKFTYGLINEAAKTQQSFNNYIKTQYIELRRFDEIQKRGQETDNSIQNLIDNIKSGK